jgi:hypothetical protein
VSVILAINLPSKGSCVLSDPSVILSNTILTFGVWNFSAGNDSFNLEITWKAPEFEMSLTTAATASADSADMVSDEEHVEFRISVISTGRVWSAGTGLPNHSGGTISITDIPIGDTVTHVILV